MHVSRPVALAVACGLGILALGSLRGAPRHIDLALEEQRGLAQKHPDDAAVQNDLGNLLELSGDRLGAEKAFRRAIELAPDDPTPRFNYGLLLLGTGRRTAALRQFRKVVDLDPWNAWAHYEIGTIWDSWGLDRLARRSYTRAFELDAQLADARVNPDVLDNEEATIAMLRAWKRGAPASYAPRAYADGSRIAGLLIEVPEAAAAEPEPRMAADEIEEGDATATQGGFARLAAPMSRAELGRTSRTGDPDKDADLERLDKEQAQREPRILDSSSLRTTSGVNQIGSSGTTRGSSRSTSSRRGSSTGRGFTPTFGSTGRLEPALRPVAPQGDVEALPITG